VPQAESLTAPGLSGSERAAVESGASSAAGLSALTVQGAKRLVALATAAAAISVEAIGAPVRKGPRIQIYDLPCWLMDEGRGEEGGKRRRGSEGSRTGGCPMHQLPPPRMLADQAV
jgi:hypothetical protein